jgi:hypothetical protein
MVRLQKEKICCDMRPKKVGEAGNEKKTTRPIVRFTETSNVHLN